MRKGNNHKRDFYKRQVETLERERQAYKEKYEKLENDRLKKIEEGKKIKRYDATVYCTNCMHVNNVSVPEGLAIKDGDCTYCRVKCCLLKVVSYPGKI